ncbi:hypothetical protein G6O67_003554 [Ophiocordyceps sinensis]|uniref:Peptidase M14 domain-containing protein n=3 Tax=Ophiocordyceps sinensis TaxID=72228 RepID=A0A8H4PS45_9HYPO|nr:hypothetical protein G6O67_003554 [Ophiocordyceps sinensis]
MRLALLALAAMFGMPVYSCLLPRELDTRQPQKPHGSLLARWSPALSAKIDEALSALPWPRHDGTGLPIGKGDRFKNGAVVPRGLGTNDRDLGSILSVHEVETGLRGLANHFASVKFFTAPHQTFENRSVYGAVIGDPRVFIQSGIHARERGGPDNVLYFVSDLLHAQSRGTGVSYGTTSFTNEQVNTALAVGIVIVPMVNPDGVAYDQATGRCWRKNRNTTSADNIPSRVGVDINRNFDINWDYNRVFNSSAVHHGTASDDPTSQAFHGLSPFSEAETRNVAWVMGRHRSLSWFLDLHSALGVTLWGWGDDTSQSADPEQSFTNRTYDGKRGLVEDTESDYQEYLDRDDVNDQRSMAQNVTNAMNAAGGVQYITGQSVELYPVSGGSVDYGLAGYYGHRSGANRLNGLIVEMGTFGPYICPFYPTSQGYHGSMRQTAVGMMEFLLNAAGPSGEIKRWPPATSSNHTEKT